MFAAALVPALLANGGGGWPADGRQATSDLWTKLEPGGGAIQVEAHRDGNLVVVNARGTAPALLPVPVPPYRALPISAQAVHTVEQFQPGSSG